MYAGVDGATTFRHKWDTVADLMGMHGQCGADSNQLPPASALEFAASNYAMITTASPCLKTAGSYTMEDATLAMAASIKADSPATLVGMYWRTDMALEIAQCSNFTAELKTHGDDYFLRDDAGQLVLKHNDVMWDYTNKEGVALFARALVNVVNQTLSDGSPVLDYVFLDGPFFNPEPGISAARNAQIQTDKMAWFADLQNQFDTLPGQHSVILNSVDSVDTAKLYNPTGAAGTMIDHWSILQFLLRDQADCADASNKSSVCGHFDAPAMDGLFTLVRSALLSNMTLQVKGWVGPVMAQPGKYPPQMHTPTAGAEQAAVAGERFNSELALFLLVAEDHMYWLFSWFWGFDSWVPGQTDSQVPAAFFPQAKCALGAPKGPPARKAGTWTYTREYEHASVFVDLNNRMACRVDFTGSC